MAELTVRMPALSATMEDALLIEWLVEVGDDVRSGQAIAEVSTDKVDMELESPYDGTIVALLVGPDTRVDLGEPIATVSSEEDDLLGGLDLDGDGGGAVASGEVEASRVTSGGPSPSEPPATAPGHGDRIVAAPPPVRHRARQLGVDLADVTPTGARGQVTRDDLARHVQEAEASAAGLSAPAERPAPADTAAASPAPSASDRAPSRARTDAIRLAVARTTTRSAAIPQFTLYRRIDAEALMGQRDGRSVVTELARALAASLWRHPECNAVWDDDAGRVVPLPGVRIGVAVDTPKGLVVAGVDDPDADTPDQADRRIRSAIGRVRDGGVEPGDSRDISSTISNLGGLDVDRFNALLVPPQPTILSVGRVVETPAVVDGHVRVRRTMEIGLTVDHRVADGADGARLLATFAARLEG